jgi:hypothetical protein
VSRKNRPPLPEGWIYSKDGKPLSPLDQLGNVVDGICQDPLFRLDFDVEEEKRVLKPGEAKEILAGAVDKWEKEKGRNAEKVLKERQKAKKRPPSRVN